MKRLYLWSEMDAAQRRKGIAKLNALARARARYDGAGFPYAWAERVACHCRFNFSRGPEGEIWDVSPRPRMRALGVHSLFDLRRIPLNRVQEAVA